MRVCLCTCACVHASVSVCVCILRVCLCRGPPMWPRVCSACKLKTVRNVCGRKANPLALLTAKHSGKRGRKERQSPVSTGASLVPAQGPLAWVLRGSGFLFLPPASHAMFDPPPIRPPFSAPETQALCLSRGACSGPPLLQGRCAACSLHPLPAPALSFQALLPRELSLRLSTWAGPPVKGSAVTTCLSFTIVL